MLEERVSDSLERFERDGNRLAQFKSLDRNVLALEKAHRDFAMHTDGALGKRQKEVQELRNELVMTKMFMETMQSDVRRALRTSHVDMDVLAELISRYKTDVQDYFIKQSQELGTRMATVDYNYQDMRSRVEKSLEHYSICQKAIKDEQRQLIKLQLAVSEVQRENAQLQEVRTFLPRIESAEHEMR